MQQKKILIIGATGKVGEAIFSLLNLTGEHDLILATSSATEAKDFYPEGIIHEVDYSQKKALRSLIYDTAPDIIINAAAMTNVDECEENRQEAWNINTEFTENLVKACKINDYHLITFSTDYIFDGKNGPYDETTHPNPINYYGKTKLAAENIIVSSQIKYTIIRTNVVYGYSSFDKHDYINWVADNLSMNNDLSIIESQWCNPTFVDDIARAVEKIIKKERYGIYNVAGADWLNRYEIAQKVAEVFNYDLSLISPMDPGELKQKAPRPEKGGLITLKAETDLNLKFSSLNSGISSLKFKLENNRLKKALYG